MVAGTPKAADSTNAFYRMSVVMMMVVVSLCRTCGVGGTRVPHSSWSSAQAVQINETVGAASPAPDAEMRVVDHASVAVDGSAPIALVEPSFVCATLDWWPPEKCSYGHCSWLNASLLNLDLSSPVLQNAIKAFSPLKLRLGGSLQDRVLYDIGELIKECTPFSVDDSRLFGFKGGCLPMARWDELNLFFQSVGVEVVFGLNALYGRGGHYSSLGPWNSTNSRNFIQYTYDKGYKISAWEFGNELSGHGVGTNISAKQYAADVKELKKIIEEVYEDKTLPRPLLVAPDGFYEEQWTIAFFEAFERNDSTIDVLTHHLYSLGSGADPDLMQKILYPPYLDREATNFQNVKQTLQEYGPSVDAWVGESGGAYNSGQHLVTDAFVSGFWYLDQMAMAASYGTKAYCRQSLVGGSYGLLNTTTFEPNPDYYGALLWHRLMGTKVLDTQVMASPLLRAYAHCGKGTEGIALLLLNFSPNTAFEVNVLTQTTAVVMDARKTTRMEYHLTPKDGDLMSQTVLLNGEPLQVNKQGQLPLLRPRVVADSAPLLVDPLSILFVSLPYLHVAACSLS